jgi:hypothetical protein
LDGEQRATLAAYWRRRAQGEMTSWVAFQHVVADLRAEASPSAVRELAERAVRDEYQHALWCGDWAQRFGDTTAAEVAPRNTERLAFRGASDAENRLLRILLCCFTETVGCFILREVRKVVREPELRRLNQRHLADELQHSRVGWGHLATLNAERRAALKPWLPSVLALLPQICCDGPEEELSELVPFGYFTPSLLRRAHDEARRDVISPGLRHLGLGENS